MVPHTPQMGRCGSPSAQHRSTIIPVLYRCDSVTWHSTAKHRQRRHKQLLQPPAPDVWTAQAKGARQAQTDCTVVDGAAQITATAAMVLQRCHSSCLAGAEHRQYVELCFTMRSECCGGYETHHAHVSFSRLPFQVALHAHRSTRGSMVTVHTLSCLKPCHAHGLTCRMPHYSAHHIGCQSCRSPSATIRCSMTRIAM